MTDFYQVAEANDIDIYYMQIPESGSISVPGAICLDYSDLYGGQTERTKLAHELGHCVTGSFYNRYSPYDIKVRHERRADKWAIVHAIPKAELDVAVKNGYTEAWELAEYFGVTEPFLRKAIEYYKSV